VQACGRNEGQSCRESNADCLLNGRGCSGVARPPDKDFELCLCSGDGAMLKSARCQDAVEREGFAPMQDAEVVTWFEPVYRRKALFHGFRRLKSAYVKNLLHGLVDLFHAPDNFGRIGGERCISHGIEDLLFLHVVLLGEDHERFGLAEESFSVAFGKSRGH
jgi:hypothetical protein